MKCLYLNFSAKATLQDGLILPMLMNDEVHEHHHAL